MSHMLNVHIFTYFVKSLFLILVSCLMLIKCKLARILHFVLNIFTFYSLQVLRLTTMLGFVIFRKPPFGPFKQLCFCVSIQVLKIHPPPFIITESINNSLEFGNFVPSLAVFRSLSYFRANTYTACIKIK